MGDIENRELIRTQDLERASRAPELRRKALSCGGSTRDVRPMPRPLQRRLFWSA